MDKVVISPKDHTLTIDRYVLIDSWTSSTPVADKFSTNGNVFSIPKYTILQRHQAVHNSKPWLYQPMNPLKVTLKGVNILQAIKTERQETI
jgi:hypothetical protein